jgi:hypothetical protein
VLSGAAQRIGFRAHQGMDERGEQLAQRVGMRSGESFSQHLGPVDIVGSDHRVDSFARVTLDGLSKNHAMTFIYPATTRRAIRSGPVIHHPGGRNLAVSCGAVEPGSEAQIGYGRLGMWCDPVSPGGGFCDAMQRVDEGGRRLLRRRAAVRARATSYNQSVTATTI